MGINDVYFQNTMDIKPREKVKTKGIESLSDAELLALLLDTGPVGENVITFSKRLLLEKGGLAGLFLLNEGSLEGIYGVGEAKKCRLLAVKEILRRLPFAQKEKIRTPFDAFEVTKGLFLGAEEEILVVLYLSKDRSVVRKEEVRSYSKYDVEVPIKLICQHALKASCGSVILLHNHPSKELKPSEMDFDSAIKIQQRLLYTGIILLDSLIVNETSFHSMKANEEGPFQRE